MKRSIISRIIKFTALLVPIAQTDANKVHWEECARYADEHFAFADEAIKSGKLYHIGIEPNTVELLDQRRESLE